MNYNTTVPIYLQVITSIKHEIVNGRMKLGEKMPSVRDLALQYTINPNTAGRVYRELESEGVCYTRRGMGTFVTEDAERVSRMREEMAGLLVQEYLEGMEHLGYTADEAAALLEKTGK